MRKTIEALKEAGVEDVVFLSSFTVRGDAKSVQKEEVIPYVHARVEICLEEVFGKEGFVAVRPGSFASNLVQYKKGLEKGEVQVFMPEAKVDNIVPEDIGRVCGTLLAKGMEGVGERERGVYLYGPVLRSQEESVRVLAKVLGMKEVVVKGASEEEAYELFVGERGMPVPLARYMIKQAGKTGVGDGKVVFGYPVNEEELGNVERYSGRKATTFEEWVVRNREMFVS